MATRPSVSRRGVVAAAVVAAAATALSGCGGSSDLAEPVTATTTVHPADRPIHLPSTTAGDEVTEPTADSPDLPPTALDVGDYEGQLYDFGVITAVEGSGGVVSIEFNRQQLYADDGTLMSGRDFNEEPIIYGNTDVPYVDDSPEVRRFVLAPTATVLRIADPVPCADGSGPAEPVWEEITVDDLYRGAWQDRTEDTLSFDLSGLVTQVRLSTSC